MAECTTRIFEAHKIPGGATIELWTGGTKADFDTVALIEADNKRWEIKHSQLFRAAGAAPASFPVVSPRRYVVTFFTSFRSTAKTTVDLNLQVVAGSPPSQRTVLNCSVAGKRPDSDHRIVFLKTLQS